MYWYHDNLKTVYLCWLSVNEEVRKQGLGTKLQEIREQIGIDIGATKSYLWVDADSWMYDWYKRRGYVETDDAERDENSVWMRKQLR